jgi:hypothetical protein
MLTQLISITFAAMAGVYINSLCPIGFNIAIGLGVLGILGGQTLATVNADYVTPTFGSLSTGIRIHPTVSRFLEIVFEFTEVTAYFAICSILFHALASGAYMAWLVAAFFHFHRRTDRWTSLLVIFRVSLMTLAFWTLLGMFDQVYGNKSPGGKGGRVNLSTNPNIVNWV